MKNHTEVISFNLFFKIKIYTVLISFLVINTTSIFTKVLMKNLAFKKLTILTKPIGQQAVEWEHKAVMRSLIAGLNDNHIPFNYNPHNIKEVGDVVMIPCNINAVLKAIELKKEGRIKKIFVGPNFYPDEVASLNFDIFLIPSEQCIRYFAEVDEELANRCRVWYVGIDLSFWCPISEEYNKSNNVLIYQKIEDQNFCNEIEDLVKKYKWNPLIIKYGSYTIEQYKKILSECRYAIFLSQSETQGIACTECWAMGIPTLIWEPRSVIIQKKHINYFSSCPYLNEKVGVYWKSLTDLENILITIESLLRSTRPCEWVQDNMTDKHSGQLLVNIINSEMNKK